MAMKYYLTLLVVGVFILEIPFCFGKNVTPEILKSYEQLKSELDEDAIGDSIKKLKTFQKKYAKYEVSNIVSKDISELRKQVKGCYHIARELARKGELERAEKILKDLATYFPDTDDGKMAKKFMQFDFYIFKAQRLMMDRKFDEAEKTVRELLTKKLTIAQTEQAERILDGISNARISQSMAYAANTKSACRILQLLLNSYYAENGKYPESLSLENLNLGDVSSQNRIKEMLSAIEDYHITDSGFSLIAVGKDGKTRFCVTQDEIEKAD